MLEKEKKGGGAVMQQKELSSLIECTKSFKIGLIHSVL